MAPTLPYAPLAEAGPEDIEFIAFLDTPRAKVNVADNPDLRDKLNEVWDIIRRVKSRRSELEDEWLAIQRMVVLDHDEGKKYNGRSNAYLPVYARARKTLISAITKSLFPSDEYMDVVDRENGESEEAKACKTVVQYAFETEARVRARIKPFIGQFVDFGWSPLKRWYRTDKILKPKRTRVAKGTIPPMQTLFDEGFTISARSAFNVVCYPEWAEDKKDLQIEAERLDVPTTYVNAMASSKRWLNVEEALNTGSSTDNFDWMNQQTLSDVSSIPNVTEFRNKTGGLVSSVIIVEAWFRMVLPPAQYAPDEDTSLPIPTRAVFVNGVPVMVRRNTFYDQQSPIEYATDNQIAGSFYGSGAGRLVRSLQYLANDFANQTNDVAIYGLNPVTLVNTNYFSGPVDSLRPGKVYRTRDVEQAMKFVSPKVEITQYGLPVLNTIIQMGQDGSGAPQILQGTKAASTATGSQLQMQGAQNPIQDTVEDIETQVMVPLMRAAWELSVQYRNAPLLRTMLGEKVSILPADINIDPEFRFLSSSQAINRQARQQGLQAFTQLMMPLLPILNSQGKTVDPVPILQRGWTDGLGNRGFDKIVIPMPMAPMPGQAGPGMPPQGPPNPNDISAVGQGNIIPPDEVNPGPGEGDVFQSIRDQSDAMTGPMGANNVPSETPY